MKRTIKREAKRVSTWGIALTALAAVGECIPAIAPFLPPPVIPVLLVATAVLKAFQGPSKESK